MFPRGRWEDFRTFEIESRFGCMERESNPQPSVSKTDALPNELSMRVCSSRLNVLENRKELNL